ncbi:PTS cellobiose transporter subunit IIC, partial [Bacteroidota bacterium]
SDIKVEYKRLEDTFYTVVHSGGNKDVFAGGLSKNNILFGSHSEQAKASFELMEAILHNESMTFANVLRQWNYIEDIIGFTTIDGKELQNYQILNDIRSQYYSKADFINGYPAATGIGMNVGGIILEFYGSNAQQEILPIKNSEQKDAYEYSQNVLIGNSLNIEKKKSSPKFERAKYIKQQEYKKVFISGTASIKSEQTVGIEDVVTQTKVTIENIQNLISGRNLEANRILNNYSSINYSFIRVYVKRPEEMEKVKNICDGAFPGIQINYLVADICRENLLVEIEGEAELN